MQCEVKLYVLIRGGARSPTLSDIELPRQPIKLSDLDKRHMKRGGLLITHFCKKTNIPNDSAEIVNFYFSHYKSMETISCHNNQSPYPIGIKNLFYPYL